MSGIPFSEDEIDYILKNYHICSNKVLAKRMSLLFGVKRVGPSINQKYNREIGKINAKKKVLRALKKSTRNKIIVSTLPLMHAMNSAGYSIPTLAAETGINETELHQIVTSTGVPEKHFEQIRAAMLVKGVRL